MEFLLILIINASPVVELPQELAKQHCPTFRCRKTYA